MKVSTVIPAFNADPFIAGAIDSALAQGCTHQEVIVVDDGSTDLTPSILASYADKIKVISQGNRGLSAARNAGIRAAQGELVAFLDADDIWKPGKLERQVELLSRNPQAAFVHSRAISFNSDSGESTRWDEDEDLTQPHGFAALLKANSICVSSVMVRRSLLDAIGDFDEAICRPTTQDYDLWLRLRSQFDVAFDPEDSVLYREHASNASKRVVDMLEDTAYVLRKYEQPGFEHLNLVKGRLADIYTQLGYILSSCGCRRDAAKHFYEAWRRDVSNIRRFKALAGRFHQFVAFKLQRTKQSPCEVSPAA